MLDLRCRRIHAADGPLRPLHDLVRLIEAPAPTVPAEPLLPRRAVAHVFPVLVQQPLRVAQVGLRELPRRRAAREKLSGQARACGRGTVMSGILFVHSNPLVSGPAPTVTGWGWPFAVLDL